MHDRRTKRSDYREEALQYLIETVADRSSAKAVALINDERRIVAGTGMPVDLVALAHAADAAVSGRTREAIDAIPTDTDLVTKKIFVRGEGFCLAALVEQLPKMSDVVSALDRIFALDPEPYAQ